MCCVLVWLHTVRGPLFSCNFIWWLNARIGSRENWTPAQNGRHDWVNREASYGQSSLALLKFLGSDRGPQFCQSIWIQLNLESSGHLLDKPGRPDLDKEDPISISNMTLCNACQHCSTVLSLPSIAIVAFLESFILKQWSLLNFVLVRIYLS